MERPAPGALERLEEEVVACRACPRLVAWRERVAAEKRAAFRDEAYWGRPVPGFGDPDARVCLVGLAPAAHGANRTGRMFTGDRSGDFLYAALWRTGFANRPASVRRGDGLTLTGAWITAPVRCAPPANTPTPTERDRCRPFLERELALLTGLRVFVPLGQFGYQVLCGLLGVRPRPPFGHGVEVALPGDRWIVGSYHVSQQNTFTGKLTEPMLDAVLVRARALAGLPPARPRSAAERDDLPRRVEHGGHGQEGADDQPESPVGGADGERRADPGAGDHADGQGQREPPVDRAEQRVGDRARRGRGRQPAGARRRSGRR